MSTSFNRTVSQVHDGRGIAGGTNYKEEVVAKARRFDESQKSQEQEFVAREAFNAGEGSGYNKGSNDTLSQLMAASQQYQPIMEGSPEDIQMQQDTDRGLNYGLLDEINQRIPPSAGQQPQPQYAEEAEVSENELIEDAQQSAFIKAQDMGDTSEENMNTLLIQELNNRGIQ